MHTTDEELSQAEVHLMRPEFEVQDEPGLNEGRMRSICEILLDRGQIDRDQYEEVVRRRQLAGGFLTDNLLALGYIQADELRAFYEAPPPLPLSIEDTGLGEQFLLDFLLKTLHVSAAKTVGAISKHVALSHRVVELLLNILRDRAMVEITGTAQSQFLLRYALTERGRDRAIESLHQSAYIGPAPVPLQDFQARVEMQSVINEQIDRDALIGALDDLVLPPGIIRQLGPAVNSGKAILLYGSSGNGKTSIAERLGGVFEQTVFFPHAVKVDEQVIKVYDPAVHAPLTSDDDPEAHGSPELLDRTTSDDPRWVACRRPVIMAGGELSLSMLDLDFDPIAKYYEAPLQVKATGGVFVIDDFGRQLVRPEDLLNRWIVPLERKVDYLTLHTGKKFEVPFDEIVIFSTNLSPAQLMDAAFLRRINYKVKLESPTVGEFEEIFRRICKFNDIPFPPEIVDFLVNDFYQKEDIPLSSVHPKLIVEHVIATCKFEGRPPELKWEVVQHAVQNLGELLKKGT